MYLRDILSVPCYVSAQRSNCKHLLADAQCSRHTMPRQRYWQHVECHSLRQGVAGNRPARCRPLHPTLSQYHVSTAYRTTSSASSHITLPTQKLLSGVTGSHIVLRLTPAARRSQLTSDAANRDAAEVGDRPATYQLTPPYGRAKGNRNLWHAKHIAQQEQG